MAEGEWMVVDDLLITTSEIGEFCSENIILAIGERRPELDITLFSIINVY